MRIDVNSAMNQSQLKAYKCNWCQARENACEQSHDWCWFCFSLANKSLANQSQHAVKQTQSKREIPSTANWMPRYMEWSSPLEERINYLQFVFHLRLCHILRTRTSKHSKWFVLGCPYLGKVVSLSRPKHPAPRLQSVGKNRTCINIQRGDC